MREEEVRLRRHYNQMVQLLGLRIVTFQVKRADLGDKELKIVSKSGSEVRVHSALLLEIGYCIAFVGVKLDQILDH